MFSFSLHPKKKQQQKHLIAGNDNDMPTPRSNCLLLGHENSKPTAEVFFFQSDLKKIIIWYKIAVLIRKILFFYYSKKNSYLCAAVLNPLFYTWDWNAEWRCVKNGCLVANARTLLSTIVHSTSSSSNTTSFFSALMA